MIFFVSTGWAWQSICFTGEFEALHPDEPMVCDDGYAKARNRWVLPEGGYSHIRKPEHAQVWDYSVDRSGLPAPLFEDFTLETFVSPDDLDLDHKSIRPRRSDVGGAWTRELRPSEMTQLPDMSFTLWDWAMGNEVCPLSDELDVQACHRFDKHMGGLNSNHFLPQSERFYVWYHDAALARARECKAADDALEALYEDREELKDYVLACEKSAMVLEAVGQHFLQDSWSAGHMWERWGSPELSDWLAVSDTTPQALGRAMLVALLSGSWHGVKPVNEDVSFPAYSDLASWDDPMCAPAPEGRVVQFIDVDGSFRDAVGDIEFEETQITPLYFPQREALVSCAVNGMRQVYEATAMRHGDGNAPDDPAAWIDPARDPMNSAQCFGQRVTNESLDLGAALHLSLAGVAEGDVPGEDPEQTGLKTSLTLILWGSASVKYSGEEDVDLEGLQEPFRNQAGAHITWLNAMAQMHPHGQEGAKAMQHAPGLPERDNTLLGISPNRAYAEPLGSQPSTWVDPQPPWDLSDEKSEALSLAFAQATAWERCDTMTVEDLNALRHLAWPAVPDEKDWAVRDLCEQLVAPHLRIGTGEGHYAQSVDKQPLCHFADDATFVYSGHESFEEVSREEALDQFCAGGLLDDGGFEQRSAWLVDYNADVLSGVNTLVPYAGSQMLDLYLTPDAGAAFGKAWQVLGEHIDAGDYALSFMWRVWTDWYECKSWGDPWAVARVDGGGEIGAVEVAVFDLHNELWCGPEHLVSHPGGRFKNDWTEAVLNFSGPVEDPVVSFIMGTGSGTDDHHLLIDNVVLEKLP